MFWYLCGRTTFLISLRGFLNKFMSRSYQFTYLLLEMIAKESLNHPIGLLWKVLKLYCFFLSDSRVFIL